MPARTTALLEYKPQHVNAQLAQPPAMSDREFGGNDDLSLPKGM
jgi:hypothetical protein